MDLPKLCFLSDFPLQNRSVYGIILTHVFEKLPEDVQKDLLKRCEIFVLGYKLGVTRKPSDKSIITLNALAMKIEDMRVGSNLKRGYHVLAHEFAHVILNHEESNEETEKEADELAKKWGFVDPDD